MTIAIGHAFPNDITLRINTDEGPVAKTTGELFAGKKVVLFGVPGAFTPTCHRNHLPGYAKAAAAIKAKGVDLLAVVAVNDVFVMDAWEKASGAGDKIQFLSDGNADLAKALGLALDGSGFGLGTRSQRFSMVIDNLVVNQLFVEDVPSNADISGAEKMLEVL